MRALSIIFGPNGPVFDLANLAVQPLGNYQALILDFATTIQNALVTLGTKRGSDPLYPDRGTTLQLDGMNGAMVNAVWTNHTANFAALLVLNFSQKTDIQSNPFKMQTFALTSIDLEDQSVLLNIYTTCVNGTTVGQQITM